MRRAARRRAIEPPLPGRSPFGDRGCGPSWGTRARALEFALLTAARTAEIRGARWCEIDFESKTWTVPAERMKAREVHAVHLSDRAIEILETQCGISTKYVFPIVRGRGRAAVEHGDAGVPAPARPGGIELTGPQ